MKKNLHEAIKLKVAGKECDEKLVIEELEKIMLHAYRARYANLGLMPNPILLHDRGSCGSSKELSRSTLYGDNQRLSDGTSIVTWTAFSNSCFDWLAGATENRTSGKKEIPFLNKIADCSFHNDAALHNYLMNSFSNHLQKMIDDLTPGLETRKKQIVRVLKKISETKSEKTARGSRQICVLKKRDNPASSSLNYANLPRRDKLKEYVRNIELPITFYPKASNSERGPSIKDKEMEAFVEKIFTIAGGAAYYDDILATIIEAFFQPVILNDDSVHHSEEYNDETSFWDVLSPTSGASAPCYEHTQKAEQIWKGMSAAIKEIFIKSVREEKKGADIAKELGKSPATITNRIKEMEEYFHKQLKDPDEGFDEDECVIILNIVSVLSMRKDQ